MYHVQGVRFRVNILGKYSFLQCRTPFCCPQCSRSVYVVYGVWRVVCGVWCMVYGVWCGVKGVGLRIMDSFRQCQTKTLQNLNPERLWGSTVSCSARRRPPASSAPARPPRSRTCVGFQVWGMACEVQAFEIRDQGLWLMIVVRGLRIGIRGLAF